MSIKSGAAIIAAKASRKLIKMLGRTGSSTPGVIATKICPDIMAHLELPENTIVITGSNGKTTTTELIYHVAKEAGLNVACNVEGSNQTEGVAAMLINNANARGVVKAEYALIESDERYAQYTFKKAHPKYFVVTNLFRDQMTRNGCSEFVRKELAKAITHDSTLIVNADDPNIKLLGNGLKTITFGIGEKAALEEKCAKHAYYDGEYCPVCGGRMEYEYRIVSHLGKYSCTECGYSRGDVNHELTETDGDRIVIDGKYTIRPQLVNMTFMYNCLAAFTVLTEAMNVDPEFAAESLSGYRISNGRLLDFTVDGHRGLFTLTKHENSVAYNGAIDTLLADPEDKTVVIIVDRLSRKHAANDMSWLWDIDFEKLADESVKRIILSGAYAHELAERVMLAGVDESRITTEADIDEMINKLYEQVTGNVYAMTCFTDVNKFTDRLRG